MIFILVIVQIITFIVITLVMRKVLISSSYKETHRLQQLNDDNLQKSKELAEKILDAENEYREKMAQCDREVREMKAEARREIEELKEAIVAKGKAESDHMIAQAMSTKKEIRAEIESEMQGKSIAFSCKIFQKVLNAGEQKLVFDGLLESVFRDLNEIEKNDLKAVDLAGAGGIVEVKSSHPMGPAQKEKLEQILSAKLDQKIKTREEIDAKVISGIIIQLGSIVIDGSLSERFRRAAEELK